MAFPYLVVGAIGVAINETVWPVTPDYTGMTSVWEDEGGTASNLYQSVNSANDSTYVTLQSVIPGTLVCGTSSEEHNFRCNMDAASGLGPIGSQTVYVTVRAEYVDLFGATGESHTMEIELLEGATQRAFGSGYNLTESPADYDLFLNTTEINSVTDWSDVDVKATITSCSGNSVANADDQQLRIFSVKIVFSP